MADTVTIRRLQQGDLREVLDLMQLSLGETPLLRRSPELFDWKHVHNPFGPSLSLVAESGGRIVALRTMMRWSLNTPGGTVVRCLRPVDTATHPEFRRRGLFRRLTLEALDIAKSEGVHLVFNTPNDQSRPGYLSMGWRDVGTVKVMARFAMPWRRGTITSPGFDPASLVKDGIPATDLATYARPAIGLRTERSSDYLKWRFATHPTATYLRVDAGESTTVVRPGERRGRAELAVSDVFGPDLRAALAAANKASSASYIVASFRQGSPERRAALSIGMVPVPGVAALRLVALPLVEIDLDVRSMKSWDFALSDLELL